MFRITERNEIKTRLLQTRVFFYVFIHQGVCKTTIHKTSVFADCSFRIYAGGKAHPFYAQIITVAAGSSFIIVKTASFIRFVIPIAAFYQHCRLICIFFTVHIKVHLRCIMVGTRGMARREEPFVRSNIHNGQRIIFRCHIVAHPTIRTVFCHRYPFRLGFLDIGNAFKQVFVFELQIPCLVAFNHFNLTRTIIVITHLFCTCERRPQTNYHHIRIIVIEFTVDGQRRNFPLALDLNIIAKLNQLFQRTRQTVVVRAAFAVRSNRFICA